MLRNESLFIWSDIFSLLNTKFTAEFWKPSFSVSEDSTFCTSSLSNGIGIISSPSIL
jgi:hypothetical protein